MTTQAIGYVRRSTDRQEESLDQQRAKLEAYAKVKGWELVHVYTDDAISGSDMDRPGLRSMMERAESDKRVDAVIAWDRNRLARPKDAIDGMMLERRLLSAGKRIVYAATGQEADSSFTSKLIGFVEHHQNGDYLRKLSRDVARGILAVVKQGHWPGGPIPFGYDRLFLDQGGTPRRAVRLLNDGSQQVIDVASGTVLETIAKGLRYSKQDHEAVTLIPSEPARVRAVQKMFADYAAGVPTRKIRDDLNAARFLSTFGRPFAIPSINVILENPAYTGRCVYNRRTESKWHRLLDGSSVTRNDEGFERRPESDWITTENAWPALVDEQTFRQVQERRKRSRELHRETTGTAIYADYLLTGLGLCGVCGSRLMGQTCTSGKGYRTRYYTCSGHHRGEKGICPKRYTVPAEPVEQHILGLIRADLERLRDDEQLHQYIAEEFRRIAGGSIDAVDQLQRRLADLDQQAAKVRDHLKAMDAKTAQAMGIYDEAKRVAEEKEQVEQELAKHQTVPTSAPCPDDVRARAAVAVQHLETVIAGGTLEEKRELISLYVQKVEADPNRQTVRISLYPCSL